MSRNYWTAAQDEAVIGLTEQNQTNAVIAEYLGVTEQAVKNRRRTLDIVRPWLQLEIGAVFGRLCVVSKDTGKFWNCVCACGKEARVVLHKLTTGHTRSCGCLLVERRGQDSITHGAAIGGRTKEYSIWTKMRDRCKPGTGKKSRENYAGRGITVCERWQSFENFLADMGPCPSPKHSIDRIDNEGNYEPGNCRWATMTEQGRNKRNNIMLEWAGLTLPLSEWCERAEMPYSTVWARLVNGSWSWPQALYIPVRGGSNV